MKHPLFVKHERLFFQLLVYRRYFETFLSLREDNKKYLKDFNRLNYFSIQFFTGYLLTHLAFLFDKDSEYSLVNARFEVKELEKKRISVLKEWNKLKDKILEISDNIGVLKYEEKNKVDSSYRKWRKMDDYEGDNIIAFMDSVAELHRNLDDFYAHEVEKEIELEKQMRKRRKKTDSEGEEVEG